MSVEEQETLYNRAIVDEARAAIGAGELSAPAVSIRCDNPLCGDRIILEADAIVGQALTIAHRTRGCLLTRAAASIVGRHAPELDQTGVNKVMADLEAILAGNEPASIAWPELLIFRPVASVRSRQDCVRLPLKALQLAIARLTEPTQG